MKTLPDFDIVYTDTDTEEDGDEIFTTFPRWCMVGKCFGMKHRLIVKDGIMFCPNCHGGYGPVKYVTRVNRKNLGN